MDNSDFKEQFHEDPQKLFEFNGVYLPEDMSIEFQNQTPIGPGLLYMNKDLTKFRLRVLYLQLVMMAGR